MADERDLDRVAHMLNVLRPEWPVPSCRTILARDHSTRPYADLVVAAAAVAVDPRTATPARLAESGPWWKAAQEANGPRQTPHVGPGAEPACDKPGHEHELARACRACRAEAIAEPDEETT